MGLKRVVGKLTGADKKEPKAFLKAIGKATGAEGRERPAAKKATPRPPRRVAGARRARARTAARRSSTLGIPGQTSINQAKKTLGL